MTQEEKELLVKDLSARLPYGVHCRVFKLNETIKEDDDILYGIIGDNVITLKSNEDECLMYYQVKPYLRSMSSMTEEEREDYLGTFIELPNEEYLLKTLRTTDWLNKHHFDYHGLIPKGLAIEVTEENNPYEN